MYKNTHKALLAKDKQFSKLDKPEQDAQMNMVLLAYTMAKAFHR
jgi:hypothetical protein